MRATTVKSNPVLVGYEEPTYFSREYKKHFGAPPQRDISKLRSNLEL
jgi:AraC-like DNA-binding protein